MSLSPLPQLFFRSVGLSLLASGDLPAFRTLCMTCACAYRSLEPEYSDIVSGRTRPHMCFRSSYLMARLCVPLWAKVRRLLADAANSESRTMSWVRGDGCVGDLFATVTQAVDGIDSPCAVKLFDLRDGQVTIDLATEVERRRSASRFLCGSSRELSMPPIFFVILMGSDCECHDVRSCVRQLLLNHVCYRLSVVFVSSGESPPSSLAWTDSFDRILSVRGLTVAETSSSRIKL